MKEVAGDCGFNGTTILGFVFSYFVFIEVQGVLFSSKNFRFFFHLNQRTRTKRKSEEQISCSKQGMETSKGKGNRQERREKE